MKNWTYKLNFQFYLLLHTCCTLFSSLRVVDGCLAEEVGDNLSSLTRLKIPVYFSPDAAFASSHSPKGGTATSSGWIDKCKARVITLKAFLDHIHRNIILLKNRKIVRYYYLIATRLHPAPSRCMLAMPLWRWPPLWSLHSSQPVLWLWLVVWLHWWSRPSSCSVGASWCPSITPLFSLRICMSSWCRLTVSRPVGVSLVVSFRSRSMWWVPWTLVLRIGFVGRWMQRRLARMFRVPPWIIWLCRNSCFLILPRILKLLCVRGVSCGFPIPKCRNFRVLYRADQSVALVNFLEDYDLWYINM